MCGIFGAVGALPDDALDRVSAALAHRGPDAEGRWRDGDVALLHRRLKIIDLSDAAAQPMPNEDGSVQVVFNGEIYNHHPLRDELVAAGHVFRSRSDTEVIVHGYERWGDAVVERLDGMFAIAVWDRVRKRLLLARDRTGKKPIFFSHVAGVFRFASEVKGLHASGQPTGVAVEQLPHYLVHGFVPPPLTLHQHVEQLPPASRLVLERGQAPRVETYWSPRFGEVRPADKFDDASRRVRALVSQAVERRLESDVPLGAFLSGGIDSTILVGVMAEKLGPGVRTFSIGFAGDPRYDETSYARIAAAAFRTKHTEFKLQPSSFELVEKLVAHHDGPFGDSSAIPTYVVAGLTREHVTVALTGDGGDELFCGYQRFLAAEVAEALPLGVRRLGASLSGLLPGGSERSLVGKARRFIVASALPLADRMARWNTFFPEPAQLLRSDVTARLTAELEAPGAWQREVFAAARGRDTLARVLEHNFRTYLPYDLLIKADRTSMAHGLELRSPFLDTALIEMPPRFRPAISDGGMTTKRILKHAFRDLLPPSIQRRGKMGFGVPLGTWFRGDLRNYLHDHLGRGALLHDYLDAVAVARFLDEHQRGVADHGQRLWVLLTLEIWLRSLARTDAAARAA